MIPLHIIPKLNFKILAHLCSVLPVVTGKNSYLLWGITCYLLSPCYLLCLVLELPPIRFWRYHTSPSVFIQHSTNLIGERVWPRRTLLTIALTERDATTQSGHPVAQVIWARTHTPQHIFMGWESSQLHWPGRDTWL